MMPSLLHFLIIDDQPITRLILIALLNGLGHVYITEAENGQQALDLLRADRLLGRPVNVVITDWNMPVMDGLTLLRTIRASDALRHLPVLMITADTQTNSIDVAMQAGADGYLDKQLLNLGTLGEQIDRVLKQRGMLVR